AGGDSGLTPDRKHAGGHEEIRRIAALAQAAGIEIAPHNPTGPICHGHSVQLCATLPNLLPLEVQFGETERFFTMTQGADQRFQSGQAPLPIAPGLALALDEAAARATPWQPMARPWLDPRLG
ncbi:MAG: enolase C-terminal domain-like protein, partial [Roseococcus sp.]